jgi:glutamine synthetase
MSAIDLVSLVCCDLGSIVRGRSLAATELASHMSRGVGWVPANHALTPLGPLAEPSPFGSIGDLRLLPDPAAHVRLDEHPGPLELVLCDIVQTDGEPWSCCPRQYLREALLALQSELGARVVASFEHEFQLVSDEPAALPFSLEAQRRAGEFPPHVMGALGDAGLEPELFFAEFSSHQFEIPMAPTEGIRCADRSVLFKEIVREVARLEGTRATFVPMLDPAQAGNGVHIHLRLIDGEGASLLFDESGPAYLSERGGSFAAGILRHARALSALTAASPVSFARLAPHHWGAGAVCVSQRNREALLRIPPLLSIAGEEEQAQLRFEYRAADSTANPYLALGSIIHAGLAGVRERLPLPPLLEADPTTLEGEEAERFGVGTLPSSLGEALEALEADELARGWLTPLLYDAYVSLKRAEIAAVAELDLPDACRLYASSY